MSARLDVRLAGASSADIQTRQPPPTLQVRPVQLVRVSTDAPLQRFASLSEACAALEVSIDRISKVRTLSRPFLDPF